jgi:hypothetical protein
MGANQAIGHIQVRNSSIKFFETFLNFQSSTAPHVVNRLSRFHRSAGLSVDGRSSSPILMAEHAVHSTAYANPRLPPFPHPTVVLPLAQLRQPSSLNSASSLTSSLSSPQGQQGSKGHLHSRQRLHSLNEESHSKPLRVAAVFAKARSWLLDPPGLSHETPTRLHRRPVDSLFVIAGHGALIQYDLDPRHAASEFYFFTFNNNHIEIFFILSQTSQKKKFATSRQSSWKLKQKHNGFLVHDRTLKLNFHRRFRMTIG